MYDFTKRNMHAIDQRYDVDHDGWPEGSGNVERPGMGPEKLDNGVYYMRGLYDLADMARAKNDGATAAWATHLADRLRSQFEQTWWDPSVSQYADSLDNPGNTQLYPEELDRPGADGGLADAPAPSSRRAWRAASTASPPWPPARARASAATRPGSLGLFHTACGGGADGKGDFEIFSLTTAIQAVGEGNYGRLGPTSSSATPTPTRRRCSPSRPPAGPRTRCPAPCPRSSRRRPMVTRPRAIPANIDRCWTCRSMVMQAWGNYGTVWPVVSQQLGVRPFLGQSALQVVPQVPGGQPSVAGSNIRLGHGSIDVFAARSGNRYTTKLTLNSLRLDSVGIGQTLPAGSRPAAVTLDGTAVHRAQVRDTNRGVEVTVPVSGSGPHTLTIATR